MATLVTESQLSFGSTPTGSAGEGSPDQQEPLCSPYVYRLDESGFIEDAIRSYNTVDQRDQGNMVDKTHSASTIDDRLREKLEEHKDSLRKRKRSSNTSPNALGSQSEGQISLGAESQYSVTRRLTDAGPLGVFPDEVPLRRICREIITHPDTDLFAPPGVHPKSYIQTIVDYFEQYRVVLRDVQSRSKTVIPNGPPVLPVNRAIARRTRNNPPRAASFNNKQQEQTAPPTSSAVNGSSLSPRSTQKGGHLKKKSDQATATVPAEESGVLSVYNGDREDDRLERHLPGRHLPARRARPKLGGMAEWDVELFSSAISDSSDEDFEPKKTRKLTQPTLARNTARRRNKEVTALTEEAPTEKSPTEEAPSVMQKIKSSIGGLASGLTSGLLSATARRTLSNRTEQKRALPDPSPGALQEIVGSQSEDFREVSPSGKTFVFKKRKLSAPCSISEQEVDTHSQTQACPMCSRDFPVTEIQSHAETCLGPDRHDRRPITRWQSTFNRPVVPQRSCSPDILQIDCDDDESGNSNQSRDHFPAIESQAGGTSSQEGSSSVPIQKCMLCDRSVPGGPDELNEHMNACLDQSEGPDPALESDGAT